VARDTSQLGWPRRSTVRLLSYNIHKGIGGRDRRYRLQRIIDVVAEQRPDVICLQEVDRGVRRSRFQDQVRVLAEAWGAVDHAFQLNHRVGSGGYGNLVLSKFPLSAAHSVNLRMGWRKSRAALVAVVDAPAGRIAIVNHHLGLAEHERHWQMETLLSAPAFIAAAQGPTVLIGDFNDWRDTLHRGALARAGFVQATTPVRSFRSFPAYMPAGALDKAFVRGVVVAAAHVVREKLARDASDHLPLVVDLAL